MTDDYTNRCGTCVHCDLYDKNSWSSACFKCKERGFRVGPLEEKCRYYVFDTGRTVADIEYARSHENGLA